MVRSHSLNNICAFTLEHNNIMFPGLATSNLKVYKFITSIKETAEIEAGMAEKSSWDQANRRQNLGLVWRNRKKIRQIIKDYFCLPFFLLIILWHIPRYDFPMFQKGEHN